MVDYKAYEQSRTYEVRYKPLQFTGEGNEDGPVAYIIFKTDIDGGWYFAEIRTFYNDDGVLMDKNQHDSMVYWIFMRDVITEAERIMNELKAHSDLFDKVEKPLDIKLGFK